MIISQGNVVMRTIVAGDLELLRIWRNAENVNRYLKTRKPISPEEQNLWFESLNYNTSIFFMLLIANTPIGLIYAHNIDSGESSFEGSIFIGDDKFKNTIFPVQAAIMLTLTFFNEWHFKYAYSTVHKENLNALDFDRKLGYEEIDSNNAFIKSKCSKDVFLSRSTSLVNFLSKNGHIRLIIENEDERYPFILNKTN